MLKNHSNKRKRTWLRPISGTDTHCATTARYRPVWRTWPKAFAWPSALQKSTRLQRRSPSAIRLNLATWRHHLHDLRTIMPHQEGGQHHLVQRVAVDRNGRFAITVSRSEDGTWVWFWDLTAVEPRRLQDPIRTIEAVEAVALAEDGQTMASVGMDTDKGSVIRLWRFDETLGQWEPGDAWLTDAQAHYHAIDIASDGKFVIAAGRDGAEGIARAWSVDTREVVCTYYQGPSIPQCVAYNHNPPSYMASGAVAVGTDDTGTGLASLRVYTIEGARRWGYEFEGAVYDVTFSRNGRLACRCDRHHIEG